ncbi:MAG: hypothetical protein ACP5D2_02740 [Candidatus Nanoarchaeia archaeon]
MKLRYILMFSILIILIGIVSANHCNPSSCDSGYDSVDVYCDLSGTNYICWRECHRDGGCGSYGSYPYEKSKWFFVDDSDQGIFMDTDIFTESSSKCYKYSSTGYIRVDDWDPDWGLQANSVKLTVGNGFKEGSTCLSRGSQNSIEYETGTHELGRGRDGYGVSTWVGYQAYSDYTCSGSKDGIEGLLKGSLFVYTADWITEDTYYEECSGSYECVKDSDCPSDGYVGSKRCSGDNVVQDYRDYYCSNYDCKYSETTKTIETCQYFCENGVCKSCDPGYVGEKYCKNGDVYQDYQNRDCSTDEELIQNCLSGYTCENGECISDCTPETCSSLGKECGSWSDGCGGTIDCGTCSAGYKCYNGQCVSDACEPETCSSLGKECGSWSDGCGGTIDCGTCPDGYNCIDGGCIEEKECAYNEDCKSLAEVVCDDGSSWYRSYYCTFGTCSIGSESPPESCISSQNKIEVYRLTNGNCVKMEISPSERKSSDYDTLNQCENSMGGGISTFWIALIFLFIIGLAVLLILIIIKLIKS